MSYAHLEIWDTFWNLLQERSDTHTHIHTLSLSALNLTHLRTRQQLYVLWHYWVKSVGYPRLPWRLCGLQWFELTLILLCMNMYIHIYIHIHVITTCHSWVLQCVAVCCSVSQFAAMCYCALQCVAVCCSILQCIGRKASPAVCSLQLFTLQLLLRVCAKPASAFESASCVIRECEPWPYVCQYQFMTLRFSLRFWANDLYIKKRLCVYTHTTPPTTHTPSHTHTNNSNTCPMHIYVKHILVRVCVCVRLCVCKFLYVCVRAYCIRIHTYTRKQHFPSTARSTLPQVRLNAVVISWRIYRRLSAFKLGFMQPGWWVTHEEKERSCYASLPCPPSSLHLCLSLHMYIFVCIHIGTYVCARVMLCF